MTATAVAGPARKTKRDVIRQALKGLTEPYYRQEVFDAARSLAANLPKAERPTPDITLADVDNTILFLRQRSRAGKLGGRNRWKGRAAAPSANGVHAPPEVKTYTLTSLLRESIQGMVESYDAGRVRAGANAKLAQLPEAARRKLAPEGVTAQHVSRFLWEVRQGRKGRPQGKVAPASARLPVPAPPVNEEFRKSELLAARDLLLATGGSVYRALAAIQMVADLTSTLIAPPKENDRG